MYSHEHAAIGAVVGAVSLPVLLPGLPPRAWAAAWGYAVLLSVFVDLDHFVVARSRTGDWSHLRRALADPVGAFTDQDAVFAGMAIGYERLLTHALLGTGLCLVWYAVWPPFAAYTGVVLYAHVVADLVREVQVERRGRG